MTDWWWSWLLTIVGVTGFILAGKKIWWSWYVNIACQFLWLAYALVTQQYGFIVASVVYFVVFSRNAYEWTMDHRDPYRSFDFNEVATNHDSELEGMSFMFTIKDSETDDGVTIITDTEVTGVHPVKRVVEEETDD